MFVSLGPPLPVRWDCMSQGLLGMHARMYAIMCVSMSLCVRVCLYSFSSWVLTAQQQDARIGPSVVRMHCYGCRFAPSMLARCLPMMRELL